MNTVAAWWSAQSLAERGRWYGVALAMALCGIHFVLLSTWYIEDAAITFAYAHHLATGEGFVTYPGGERVQGFSNPTWTLLLGALDLVGVSPWVGAKLFGFLFTVLTVPLAYRWARRFDHGQPLVALLAPFLIAVSPQHVIWGASGLENSLMNLLLAAGVVWMLEGGVTSLWAALPLGLLAITRPEAPLYVAITCVLGTTFFVRRHGLSALRWVVPMAVLVVAPWLAWMGFCWWYFAWPLPNTYYAKVHDNASVNPYAWGSEGWKYTRRWALHHTWGFLLPLAPLGHSGLRGPRARVGVAVAGLTAIVLVPGLGWLPFLPEEPFGVMAARLGLLAFLGLLVPCLGAGRPHDEERILAWALACTAALFPVFGSGGDWMTQFRFLSVAQVPLAVLMVDLVGQVLQVARDRGVRARAQRIITVFVAGPVIVASIIGTIQFLANADTAPYGVYERVRHMRGVRERLHLDHVSAMEVDMGAQMWWGDYELLDMAGLVDTPIGHHNWELPFMREYVLWERRPDFAHVHDFWMRRANMDKLPLFKQQYVEVPGYTVVGGSTHIGNFVRRDHLLGIRWGGTTHRAARFDEEVTLHGIDIPARQVAPGQALYLELGITTSRHRPNKVRPLVFLVPSTDPHGEHLVVREVPIGYDWVRQADWRRNEVITTRVTLSLPDDLPLGEYDLGIVMARSAAEPVLQAREPSADPVLARGEVRWHHVVAVRPLEEIEARVQRDTATLVDEAAQGHCSEAERALARTRRHLKRDHPLQPRDNPDVVRALAGCWARDAVAATTDTLAEQSMARARRWDHWHPEVRELGAQLADRFVAAADAARDAGDDEAEYQALRRAMVAEPTRSWVRRRAETVRDRRLGIHP